MEDLGDNELSTVVEIAADGDVILVVGPEKVKLRVHSLFLKAVSKPFSAMFGLDWKEGHTILDRDGPVEIPLPEDNAAALKIICAIIHHQNKEVPETLAASNVLRVAITAYKYGCIDVLKFVSGHWLRPSKIEVGDLMLLTTAAYTFQNTGAFKDITRVMILNHNGPYIPLLYKDVESGMAWKIVCLLEEQRSIARLKLAEILIKGIDDGTGMCVHKCGWTSKYAYAYLKLLEGKDLLPSGLLHISISRAIELAEKMPDPIPEEASIACTCECKHATPEYRKNRRRSLETLNNSIGLCLQCIRSGSIVSNCNRDFHNA